MDFKSKFEEKVTRLSAKMEKEISKERTYELFAEFIVEFEAFKQLIISNDETLITMNTNFSMLDMSRIADCATDEICHMLKDIGLSLAFWYAEKTCNLSDVKVSLKDKVVFCFNFYSNLQKIDIVATSQLETYKEEIYSINYVDFDKHYEK